MNFLTVIITQIQTAIRGQIKFITIEETKVELNFNTTVFITMNPGYAGRVELPVSLKNLFRSVQMVVPDDVFICEILLYSNGFINAPELSKKICHVQKLANVLMKKTSCVNQDFGLRAIRAIISIADSLKLVCQNFLQSELPDIINEE